MQRSLGANEIFIYSLSPKSFFQLNFFYAPFDELAVKPTFAVNLVRMGDRGFSRLLLLSLSCPTVVSKFWLLTSF